MDSMFCFQGVFEGSRQWSCAKNAEDATLNLGVAERVAPPG